MSVKSSRMTREAHLFGEVFAMALHAFDAAASTTLALMTMREKDGKENDVNDRLIKLAREAEAATRRLYDALADIRRGLLLVEEGE